MKMEMIRKNIATSGLTLDGLAGTGVERGRECTMSGRHHKAFGIWQQKKVGVGGNELKATTNRQW